MNFTEIDHWIGRTLFVPPIVKLCQLTRQSQFAISRLFWLIAALDGFYRAQTWFSAALFGGMSVLMLVTASLRADMPTRSALWFRMMGLLFLVLDVVEAAVRGGWTGAEFWIFVLIAEYAATIRTIPPAESPRRAPAAETGRR